MKYVAFDGKVFDDEVECSQHETDLKESWKDRDLDWEKLKEKQRAYENARKDFEEEIASFNKKYLVGSETDIGLRKIFEWFIS